MYPEIYERIECGMQRVEYRRVCPKYIPVFRDKHPKCVRLNYGYTTRQMIWEIEKISEGEVIKGEKGFLIELGKRLQ